MSSVDLVTLITPRPRGLPGVLHGNALAWEQNSSPHSQTPSCAVVAQLATKSLTVAQKSSAWSVL